MNKILLAVFAFATCVSWADMASMAARIPKLVELKDQGIIGEKRDGMVGAVKSSADAADVVAAENKDRLTIYQERAATAKVGLTEFLKVMGDERIQKEPAGRYVQDASGAWIKK